MMPNPCEYAWISAARSRIVAAQSRMERAGTAVAGQAGRVVRNVEAQGARAAQVTREDLIMFINACFACTGQREFYQNAQAQNVSIAFLHQYILGNYRLLYARSLAVGINHFNQGQILLNLLATGRDTHPAHRAEENALINAALHGLPPQRAWRLWEQARQRGINNRRTRAMARDFLAQRPGRDFEAVKYRAKVRALVTHAHLRPGGELERFLFRGWKEGKYATPLFDRFREAHYAQEAIYGLPFTIAEGLAHKHNIPRDVFLKRIAPQMTLQERLRMQNSIYDMPRVEIEADLARQPLTRLALYALSLKPDERNARRSALDAALRQSARHTLHVAPLTLGRVAAVLDCSYSSSGSSEKRRRPLGVALAAHYLLREAGAKYRAFWTLPAMNHTAEDAGLDEENHEEHDEDHKHDAEVGREQKPPPSRLEEAGRLEEAEQDNGALMVQARGQTDIVTPLLAALAWKPDLIVIVSDGYENDPPCGASEALRVIRTRLDPEHRVSIVHCNPVFDEGDFAPHALSPHIPTVGLRDAEDLPTMLGFARLADGTLGLPELESYLSHRAQRLIATAHKSNAAIP